MSNGRSRGERRRTASGIVAGERETLSMHKHFATHRPMLMGTRWMVTADHPLAAQAGASVMADGGNAVDAAVAANLVMAVVRPHMCGIGGDLFMLIYSAETGQVETLNASGRSPARATLEAYRSRGYRQVPAAGIHACTVPGALAGWQAVLERYGTLGLDTLLARALPYAEDGFPATPDLVAAIDAKKALLSTAGAACDVFLPGGRVPRVGQVLVHPRLSASLRLLIAQGPDAFYRGPLGEAFVCMSSRLNGFFDEDDLRSHHVDWEPPIRTAYRGVELVTAPPNSQGIALLMQAAMLNHVELTGTFPNSAEMIHRMVEIKKIAFADRDAYVCDPAFYPVPVRRMLDERRARNRLHQITPNRAAVAYPSSDFSHSGEDTVYAAAVDDQGNAVALIQSLFEAFGSGLMVPQTGMLLHNRAQGFTLTATHPNVLAPKKRPYHTLVPAMIFENERPLIVFGTPGADGQTQTNMQLVVDMIDFEADPQQATEAPRWRSNPDGSLLIENRFPAKTIEQLEGKGHRIHVLDGYDEMMGSCQVIRIDRVDGVFRAGADPRRQAYAIGR